MPNNSYLRSTRREREIVNDYRSKGWDACRSAGSHSPWDVWCFNPKTKEVHLIQVKTKKGGRTVTRRDSTLDRGCIVETWEQHYE